MEKEKKIPAGQNIGYIRVSSSDQNPDRQLADYELDDRYIDKCSGSTTNRPGFQSCMKYMRRGDTLHVHSIDRLARNMADLLAIVDDLLERDISLQFHKENLFFEAGKVSPMQTMMLQLMGSFAEFERNLIRERQREGIEAARKAGKRLGPKPKLTDQQKQELIDQCNQPGANKKAIAKDWCISRQTLYVILREAA